jgi:hypothetical protein
MHSGIGTESPQGARPFATSRRQHFVVNGFARGVPAGDLQRADLVDSPHLENCIASTKVKVFSVIQATKGSWWMPWR